MTNTWFYMSCLGLILDLHVYVRTARCLHIVLVIIVFHMRFGVEMLRLDTVLSNRCGSHPFTSA